MCLLVIFEQVSDLSWRALDRETHNSSAREFESQLGQPELTIIPESGSEQNLSNLHGSPQSIAGNVRKDEVSQAKSALPLSEQNGTDEAHKVSI